MCYSLFMGAILGDLVYFVNFFQFLFLILIFCLKVVVFKSIMFLFVIRYVLFGVSGGEKCEDGRFYFRFGE